MGILNNGLKNKTFTNNWSLLPLTSAILKQLYHSLVRGGSSLHFLIGLASTQTEAADITRRHCITCNPPTLHIACMVKQEVSATSRFPCRVSEGSDGGVMEFCEFQVPLRWFKQSLQGCQLGRLESYFKKTLPLLFYCFVQAKRCPLTLNKSKTNANRMLWKQPSPCQINKKSAAFWSNYGFCLKTSM